MERLRRLPEVLRFAINGLVATGVHFLVLVFNIEMLEFSSAGVANAVAASFGIASSFVGSRYFVFPNANQSLAPQLLKFVMLYGAIALLHGVIMAAWVDWQGLNYILGFIVATLAQLTCSFLGNKFLVFTKSV